MAYSSLLNMESGNNNNSSISSLMPMWLFTNSGSWTCPEDGLYRLVCIGKGGDGGDGSSYVNHDSNNRYPLYGYDGCGGAGGGVAIADQQLTSGVSLTIAVNSSYSSINDTALKATAGGNGYDAISGEYYYNNSAPSSSGNTIPSGGIASGTWLKYGFNGQKPETPNTSGHTNIRSSEYYIGKVYSGGNAGCILSFPAINGNAGMGVIVSNHVDGSCGWAYIYRTSTGGTDIGSTLDDIPSEYKNVTIPNGGMIGAGGACGALCLTHLYDNSSGSFYNHIGQGKGGKGGSGAVLIQRIG